MSDDDHKLEDDLAEFEADASALVLTLEKRPRPIVTEPVVFPDLPNIFEQDPFTGGDLRATRDPELQKQRAYIMKEVEKELAPFLGHVVDEPGIRARLDQLNKCFGTKLFPVFSRDGEKVRIDTVADDPIFGNKPAAGAKASIDTHVMLPPHDPSVRLSRGVEEVCRQVFPHMHHALVNNLTVNQDVNGRMSLTIEVVMERG